MLIGGSEITSRWTEYVQELFDGKRSLSTEMTKNSEGPPIINEEVELAIKKTKNHKSPGPDEIKVEEIKALGEFGTQKLAEIIAEIYETGEIPDDLTKSVFIALPKKSNATKCEQHRTISLMSHVTKIMLRVILSRVRNKTKPEIHKRNAVSYQTVGQETQSFCYVCCQREQ